MKSTRLMALASLACGLALPSAASGNITQDLLPLKKGYVTATCFSNSSTAQYAQDLDGFVVAVIDASASEIAAAPFDVAGGSHPWKRFHDEMALQNPGAPSAARIWNARNLGEVFGVTLDDAASPNIYVSATTVYGQFAYPAGNHSCTVYRLNGTDGTITAFNSIPPGSNKAGLGNLCFHRSGNGSAWLYVSSLEDGNIYRLDAATGVVTGAAFDHGVAAAVGADDATQNFTQTGRRVWGVQVKKDEKRLYYGVWNSGNHAIWSVSLDPVTGAFVAGSAIAQIASIPFTPYNSSCPPSDISFSETGAGRMVFAERYHSAAGYGSPHNCRVLEYTGSSGAWVASPTMKWSVGNYLWGAQVGSNSAGGVDFECSGAVWATGDALNLTFPNYIYGLMRIPAGGNLGDAPPGLNSHYIDLDCVINNVPKTFQGDVEIYDPCACLEVSQIKVDCPTVKGGPFTANFTLKNTGTQTARYVWYTPCPAASLPAGAVTTQPAPVGPTILPAPLLVGGSVTQTITLPGVPGNTKVCFRITLLDDQGEECCTEKVCFDTPDCDCFIVKSLIITPKVNSAGKCEWEIKKTIQNISPFTWYSANFLPPLPPTGPATFTPATIDLSGPPLGPVPPGGTVTLTTVVSGYLEGQELCFYLSLHTNDLVECCSQKCCIVLPPCDGDVKPDYCEVTRIANCCPSTAGQPPHADIYLTVCNCGPFAKTYNWSIAGLGIVPPCNTALAAAQFGPQSGTIDVPAGGCRSVLIRVNCAQMQPGACAAFEVCVQETGNPANRFCCQGQVRVPPAGELIVKPVDQPGGAVVQLPAGGTVGKVDFDFINPTGAAITVNYVATTDLSAYHVGNERVISLSGSVTVPAGSTQRVSIPVSADSGLPAGINGQLFLTLKNEAGSPVRTVASMGLAASQTPGPRGFRVRNVQIVNDIPPYIELIIPTEAGKHYRIQQSVIPSGAWVNSKCSIPGVPLLPDGSFVGTGGDVICHVPCDFALPRVFFRGAQLD